MRQLQSLDQQIMNGLREVDASPHFSDNHCWLTFYLSGPEHGLQRVASTLVERGWINADGWDSGFIYPKKRVLKAASEILELALEVKERCHMHRAEIELIDADTAPDERSKFVTLFRNSA
jgi:hypothetical protein